MQKGRSMNVNSQPGGQVGIDDNKACGIDHGYRDKWKDLGHI